MWIYGRYDIIILIQADQSNNKNHNPTWQLHIPKIKYHLSNKNNCSVSLLHSALTLHFPAPPLSMASLAASTAAASIGVSEMLGNFSVASRPAPSASSPVTFKTVALFGKKKAAPPPKKAVAVTPASDELAKWYGKCLRL